MRLVVDQFFEHCSMYLLTIDSRLHTPSEYKLQRAKPLQKIFLQDSAIFYKNIFKSSWLHAGPFGELPFKKNVLQRLLQEKKPPNAIFQAAYLKKQAASRKTGLRHITYTNEVYENQLNFF